MNKFRVGDRVSVSRDIAGMFKGEKATVIDYSEHHGVYAISMWEYDGIYNMLPEDLERIVND